MKPSGPNSGKIPNGKEVLTTGKKKKLRQVASDESPLCLSNDLRPLSSVACLLSTSLLDRRSTWRCCDRVLIFTLPSFYHFLPYHSLIPPGMKDLACEFWRSIGYLVSLPRDKKGLSISSTLFESLVVPNHLARPPLVFLVRQTWLPLANHLKFFTPPKLRCVRRDWNFGTPWFNLILSTISRFYSILSVCFFPPLNTVIQTCYIYLSGIQYIYIQILL